MWNRSLALVCAAGLGVGLLAGCGSPSPITAPTASASQTSSPGSPVASPSASPPERAQLRKILLQTADLPAGSKGRPSNPANTVTMEQDKARCVGVRNTDAEIYANAHSDDFTFPDGRVVVVSSAKSYPLQNSVDEYVAMVRSPKFSRCYEQMMRDAGGPGDTFEELSVTITPGSAGGPTNVVATGTSTLKLKGQPAVALSMAFINGR